MAIRPHLVINMEKSQGATLGAVILAALFLRPGTANSPQQQSAATPRSAAFTSTLQGNAVSGDGPWVASCEFWAPERPAPDDDTSLSTIAAASTGTNVSLSFNATMREEESDCKEKRNDLEGLRKWGIPPTSAFPNGKAKITAIIATVPDPIRTNLGLQFDWGIDAMLAAAADNGYLSTYYWLPWDNKSRADEASHRARTQSAEQERQPGLIILKPIHDPVQTNDLRSAVYVFLVAETPTSGINAYEMERAFDYEDLLAKSGVEFQRSLAGGANQVDIIGPVFSASAATLRRTLEYWLEHQKSQTPQPSDNLAIYVTGATATTIAADQMNGVFSKSQAGEVTSPPSKDVPCGKPTSAGQNRIRYVSFEGHANYAHDRIRDLLLDSNARSSRIAFLIEDGTTLGQDEACAPGKSGCESPGGGKPILIRFPREISLLRNAETGEQPISEATPPTPYLRLSLKDTNAYDGVPHFSREDTPLIQESELMAIVRQLR